MSYAGIDDFKRNLDRLTSSKAFKNATPGNRLHMGRSLIMCNQTKLSNALTLEKDFHGYNLVDAIHELHILIGEVRSSSARKEVKLITGHGQIKKEFLQILAQLDIECNVMLGNTGTIVAIIE